MRPPQTELGWANPLLLKQFFRAFDVEKRGEITFPEFAEGYSAMLRGTVPELLAFAWRVYHCSGPAELLAVAAGPRRGDGVCRLPRLGAP